MNAPGERNAERAVYAEDLGEEVVVHIREDVRSAFLSILLNSKFGDEPRWDFLLSPFVNDVIDVLVSSLEASGSFHDPDWKKSSRWDPDALRRVLDAVKHYKTAHHSPEELEELTRVAMNPYDPPTLALPD